MVHTATQPYHMGAAKQDFFHSEVATNNHVRTSASSLLVAKLAGCVLTVHAQLMLVTAQGEHIPVDNGTVETSFAGCNIIGGCIMEDHPQCYGSIIRSQNLSQLFF